jgi:hypothetical protein
MVEQWKAVHGNCKRKLQPDIPILSLSPLTIRTVALCDSAYQFIETESMSSADDQYSASDETRAR